MAVREAYYTLAKKYHPDRNVGDKEAEERFREVNNAYTQVSKAILRYCDLLGVTSNSSNAEIGRAYTIICEKYKANKGKTSQISEDYMREVDIAYRFLSGSTKTKKTSADAYDAYDGW